MPHRVRTLALLIAAVPFAFVAGCDEPEVGTSEAPEGFDNPTDWESQGALRTAPSKAPRTIAAMMFDIGGGPPNAANIMNVIGGTGSSQRHMFQEVSYGIQDTAPEYFGPYRLPQNNCLTIACCGPSSDRTGNGATVQMHMDALGKTFNHYFWVYGTIPSGANCGTWGDEGSPNRIAVYSSYSFHQIVGYAQEIGHNFGMTHEPIMTCTGGASFLDNTAQCTHKEYGNTLSFMGSGARHPSAYHKYHQGWMSGCNVVKVGSSAEFTLVPQELPCDGVQLLQIPAPKTRSPPAAGDRQGSGPMLTHYYLEMRAPLGFDSGLGPMVLVSIGPDLPNPARNAPYLYMLDMNASTSTLNDAGLKAGQSYSDPSGGFTVTVTSIDNTAARIMVTTGGAGATTCSNGTAFTPPGMDGTSCGPLSGGGSGTAGTTGGAGTSGRGGTTGTAGRGGTTGAGGRGGTLGGAAGTTGGGSGTSGATAGTTGGTGTAGTSGGGAGTTGTGTAGTTGTGQAGTIGTTGMAGTTGPMTGTAGSNGAAAGTTGTATGSAGTSAIGAAGAGGPGQGGAATGGCACDSAGTGAPSGMWAVWLGLGLMASIARRRSRRAPSS